MKSLWPYIGALLVAFFGTATVGALDRAWTGELRAQERHEISAQVSALSDGIESDLQSLLAPATGLVALVAHSPNIEQREFEQAAKRLIGDVPGVRSVSLAKDSTVSHVHPFAANRQALGLNLAEHPEQGAVVRRAIDERRAILSGPVELVQGGRAFVGRTPIFLGERSPHYWGLATVLIDSDEFLESKKRRIPSLRLVLRGRDAEGKTGDVFFGDAAVFDEKPVISEVVVPGGSWQIAAVPVGGWATGPRNAVWKRGLGLGLVLLFASLTFIVLFAYARLRVRTEELALALGEVRTLKGLLPVCSNCKSVRDDQGLWSRIERYIEVHSNVEVTHSICPSCLVELYGSEMAERVLAAAAVEDQSP